MRIPAAWVLPNAAGPALANRTIAVSGERIASIEAGGSGDYGRDDEVARGIDIAGIRADPYDGAVFPELLHFIEPRRDDNFAGAVNKTELASVTDGKQRGLSREGNRNG